MEVSPMSMPDFIKQDTTRSKDHFLRRFEETHGKDSVGTFRDMIEQPFSTLVDVARHFGFSKENARLVYRKMYGVPYTELLQKKKEARRRRREKLRQKRLLQARLESKRLSPVIQAMARARGFGFNTGIRPDGKSYILYINGHKAAVRGASKATQIGRKRYFHVGKKCRDRDFYICMCKDNGSEAYYVIPSDVMPESGTFLPAPNDEHSGKAGNGNKYLQFREAWHLLA
jgi:hypothetical protein